jgi:hypothetical protein
MNQINRRGSGRKAGGEIENYILLVCCLNLEASINLDKQLIMAKPETDIIQ